MSKRRDGSQARCLVAAVLVTAVAGAALEACGSGQLAVGTVPSSPVDPGAAREGEALYEKYCLLCHGSRGVGHANDNATAIGNPAFLATASDAFIVTGIGRGRPGTAMAAYAAEYGGPLDGDALARLLAYLRSLETGPRLDVDGLEVAAGDAVAGAEIYRAECAGCHGPRGEGDTAQSLNNPQFLATVSAGFLRYTIHHGRPGTPMPGFGGALSGSQMDDLTALIRSWAGGGAEQRPGRAPAALGEVVVNPGGPEPSFSPLREGRYVPAKEVKQALDLGSRLVLLDARPTSDWLAGHIPGAVSAPYYADLAPLLTALPRDGTWIVAYCACPHAASGKVMDKLRAAGFANTAVLDEGVVEWTERGYPIAAGSGD